MIPRIISAVAALFQCASLAVATRQGPRVVLLASLHLLFVASLSLESRVRLFDLRICRLQSHDALRLNSVFAPRVTRALPGTRAHTHTHAYPSGRICSPEGAERDCRAGLCGARAGGAEPAVAGAQEQADGH